MEYRKAIKADTAIQRIKTKLEAGTATHRELGRLASIAGKLAGECIADQLHEEFPNGQVSEEDVRRIISPIMKQNYSFVVEMSALLQNKRYEQAGVGLKADLPDYNKSREDELVKEISRRSFDNGFFG